mmetsp:Transcript_44335/g.143871  ORF Transcript_44335/g.143871 Transcript_44335/m.143871 type:complete len:221 (-) Transcript_44335:264-926(-)
MSRLADEMLQPLDFCRAQRRQREVLRHVVRIRRAAQRGDTERLHKAQPHLLGRRAVRLRHLAHGAPLQDAPVARQGPEGLVPHAVPLADGAHGDVVPAVLLHEPVLHDGRLDGGLLVEPLQGGRVVLVRETESPRLASRHVRLHLPPGAQCLLVRRQRRVEQEAVEVVGSQVAQRRGDRLLHLLLHLCCSIVRQTIGILARQWRVLGLHVQISSPQAGGL